MFFCPSCKTKLVPSQDLSLALKCEFTNCSFFDHTFNKIDNVPILIPFGFDECIFKNNDFNNLKQKNNKHRSRPIRHNEFFVNIKRFFYGQSKQSLNNFRYLSQLLTKDLRVLIIGGAEIGSAMSDFHSDLIDKCYFFESVDVYPSPNITVIADAHYLPYPDNFFDLVIIQAVLEHVVSPKTVVSEIYRVLSTNGTVYAETPFLQSVHEGPFDFTRFTHSGHRWLFRDFSEIKSGYISGGFSSTLFVLSHTLSALFRTKIIGIFLRLFFARIALAFDLLIPYKFNIDVGSGFYFLGLKPSTNFNNLNLKISDYYSGGQNS